MTSAPEIWGDAIHPIIFQKFEMIAYVPYKSSLFYLFLSANCSNWVTLVMENCKFG